MKKLFTNDSFFLGTTICTTLSGIICAILTVIAWGFSWTDFLIIIIRISCCVILYLAYKKHDKNVMKGMMGALLMIQLVGSIFNFSLFSAEAFIFMVAMFVFTAALFINHFIINSDHHSKPLMVYSNQILVSLIILTNTAWIVQDMCIYHDLYTIITDIFDLIAYGGVSCIIVCVESRLDAYRIDRETAGWTEEKGYPEGYIHQKDR